MSGIITGYLKGLCLTEALISEQSSLGNSTERSGLSWRLLQLITLRATDRQNRWLFVNQRQDDWLELQYNIHIHSATQYQLFFLETGRLPGMCFKPEQSLSWTESINEFTEQMKTMLEGGWMLGDPHHQTFLPSPLPCPHLSTSCLTIITPSLYHPHPSTISLPSTHCHLAIPLVILSFVSPFLCLQLYPLSHTAYFIILLFYGSTFIC